MKIGEIDKLENGAYEPIVHITHMGSEAKGNTT